MADRSERWVRFVFPWLLMSICALYSGPAFPQTTDTQKETQPPRQSLQQEISQHEQKLADARAAKNQRDEASELIKLGAIRSGTGANRPALVYFEQALPLWRALNDRSHEGMTLTRMGKAHSDLGEKQQALDLYAQALQISRDIGDRDGEATVLTNSGKVYSDLGEKQKALSLYNQALSIEKTLDNHTIEATTLNNMGKVYSDLGQHEKSMEYYNQALPIQRKAGELGPLATTLNNIGAGYRYLGQLEKSLDYYNQALPIVRETGDRFSEALVLNNIGGIYGALSRPKKALDYYNLALSIRRTIGDRGGEAASLTSIGAAHDNLGEHLIALDFHNQALVIRREIHDRVGEGGSLINIGSDYGDLGDQQKALDFYNQALPIQRDVGDRAGEARTLWWIALSEKLSSHDQNILPYEVAALSLAHAVEELDLQGKIEASLMRYFRDHGNPQTALFFGTQAINSFQRERSNITGLDQNLQKSFTQSRSSTYRQLAELLVQTDRLGEAEHVLDLLKEQELKEVVRGAASSPAAKVEPLPLTPAQQKAEAELTTPETAAIALTGISMEYTLLLAKPTRTSAEDAQLKQLDARIEAGNAELSAFFKTTLYPELAQKAGTTDANALLSKEKSDVSRLQNTLAELGPRVLGIRLLLGEDHAYAILITAHTREKIELKATPAELRSKVLQARDDLRSPTSNPRPHLAELYAMVVVPLAPNLKVLESQRAPTGSAPVPTLLWSLDGVMRYIPIAALYDGTHYMAERFNNVLFTPESYGHMTAPADTTALRVLAMGLSKSYSGLPALPGVMPELEAVVHDPAVPASHGPISGVLLGNDQFTLAALKTQLGAGTTFPVVHIASHFVVEAGSGEEPYLMLGGDTAGATEGYALTLSKLSDSTITFHGTRLLTLSACSTAKGDAAQDGLEIDSLGMIAQQKDAEAVLATLWDVNDASTSHLMSDFYTRWLKSPTQGKAEALRQAQLALLHGAAPSPDTKAARGLIIPDEATPSQQPTTYAHPFYWAPFVLIGNFQ